MPWGMDFNFGMPEQDSFQYPVQESYQNNLANSFGPSFQSPAMNAYQEFLGNAPSREDFNQPWWMKALAGLGGFATGWQSKDPTAGGKATQQMLDAPYLQALQQYQTQELGLRNAATIEERGLGNQINAMRYQQQGMMDQQKGMLDQQKSDRDFQIEKMKLDNAFKIAGMNETNELRKAELQQKHYEAMQALEAQRISVTREGNQMDLLQSFNPMNILKNLPRQNQGQDEGFMKFQLENALKSDPMFQNAWGDTGFNIGNIDDMTPEQYARYQQYIQQFSGQR